MTKGALIGRGRTAEIYAWGNDQIIKLFYDWCPALWAEHEVEISQVVQEAGLPVPACGGLVEVEGRRGLIYERIQGSSMLREMLAKPWKLLWAARTLAGLQAAIHRCVVPGLPSHRQQMERCINEAAWPQDVKEAALHALSQLPAGQALCHGDFHPDNILLAPRGPVIIDWLAATQGNPLADVARTSLLLRLGEPVSGTPGRRFINLIRAPFHALYMRRYLQLRPGSRQEIVAWQLPVAAARLCDRIPGEQAQLHVLVAAILSSPT